MKAALKEQIVRAIEIGYKTFLCGMAIGFDMICAETVLSLKEQNPEIKLIGALPCRTQGDRWSAKNRKRYEELLSRLDGVRCIYDDYHGIECMHERNRYMVDKSSLIIALYNGASGGTKSTIDYARKQGLEIVIIEP